MVRELAVVWLIEVLASGFDPSSAMMQSGARAVAIHVADVMARPQPAFVHHCESFALDAMHAHRRFG